MLNDTTNLQLSLCAGEAVSLLHAKNCNLYCTEGTIWVTEENRGEDFVLRAGDQHPVSSDGRVVVQSMGSAGSARCRMSLPMRCSFPWAFLERWNIGQSTPRQALHWVLPRLERL